ncbi:MAG TPA: hypothetical protein VGZ24_05495 [Chthoniobacterales bacterium]|jgi:hypothetical protein|nr:hypothetical protein [Chthoniobacterales bacterium]
MRTPLYAALDLHSPYSVLDTMDHEDKSEARKRFATEAKILADTSPLPLLTR